ncbi:MAG: uroporphyrinogen-III synthase [Polyangiaceae bacterium]
MTLAGATVLLTRARAQSQSLVALLEAEGANCLVFPVIELRPPVDPAPFEAAIGELGSYAWVVFTSANAARATLEEVDRQATLDALAAMQIAVVGPATAKVLHGRGLVPALVATESIGDAFAAELLPRLAPASRLLLPRAKVAREVLPEALREAGHTVDVVTAYETVAAAPADAEAIRAKLRARTIDWVTVTSSSTVEHLLAALGADAEPLLRTAKIASIGPVTTATATAAGLEVAVTASRHTMEGLVAAMSG